jgi:hypothetical protein
MSADNRHETFAVNQFLGAMEGMLEHGPPSREVHKLLRQRLPSELFNERLQAPAVTCG